MFKTDLLLPKCVYDLYTFPIIQTHRPFNKKYNNLWHWNSISINLLTISTVMQETLLFFFFPSREI